MYNLNGYNIPIQYSVKDLGITFSDNMSFNIHINNICNKSYLIINILFRFLITNNYIYLIKAYISYVCPLFESDSDPLYITNSNHIENIQKYFTKRFFARCNIPKCSYTDRLIFLNIKSSVRNW